MASAPLGFLLLFVAAVSGGLFTIPMGPIEHGIVTKTGWTFEAFWFVYVFITNIVLLWSVAAATIPDLLGAIAAVDISKVLLAALFGFLWGIGCQTFGLAISKVGNSLGFALIMGLAATLGSVIPLVVLHPGDVGSRAGLLNFTGLGLAIVALAITAYAGILKDQDSRGSDGAEEADTKRVSRCSSSFSWGLVLCIVSGCFSACLNLATNFGRDLADVAVARGAAKAMGVNAIYAVSIATGSLPCLSYCGFRMVQQGTNPFAYSLRSWIHAVSTATLMSTLWLGSNIAYGVATVELAGDLGAVVGWPIYIIGMVIFANIGGILSGEWRKACLPAKLWMGFGLAVLCLAVVAVGLAG